MLFLTSELPNEAKITILSARDTTRAWVPGRGIMGRNVGVYKNGYNTWLSSRLQNQPRSFRFVLFNFPFAVRVMSVTKDEVPDQIKVNNDQLMASFKGALSQAFCCFQLHSLLKSLPSTFSRSQNAQID